MTLKNIRAVPERARESLDNLDAGIRQANATMTILASVALVALGVALVALLRSSVVMRRVG